MLSIDVIRSSVIAFLIDDDHKTSFPRCRKWLRKTLYQKQCKFVIMVGLTFREGRQSFPSPVRVVPLLPREGGVEHESSARRGNVTVSRGVIAILVMYRTVTCIVRCIKLSCTFSE